MLPLIIYHSVKLHVGMKNPALQRGLVGRVV